MITFSIVDGESKQFSLVEDFFSTTIETLYGDQSRLLKKIASGRNRLCEILMNGDEPLGLLVCKQSLSGADLVVETLALFDPENQSGKGYRSMLLRRVFSIANSRRAASVCIKVSNSDSIFSFLQKKGFSAKSERSGHLPDSIETVLSRSIISPSLSPDPDVLLPEKSLSADIKSVVSDKTEKAPIEVTGPRGLRSVAFSRATSFFRPVLKCPLRFQYIKAIKSGKKIYEGRVATPSFNAYQQGAFVEWHDEWSHRAVVTEITSRHIYKTFTEMLNTLGFENFLPGEVVSLLHAVSVYRKIPNYAERVEQFGALALGLRVLEEAEIDQLIRDRRYTPSFGDSSSSQTPTAAPACSGHALGLYAAKRKNYSDSNHSEMCFDPLDSRHEDLSLDRKRRRG